jgi:hypothetical protein
MDSMDAQLEIALRTPEPAIGDDDFSETVLGELPGKRLGGTRARRWTLGAAAAAGSLLASLLSAPAETAFSSLVLEGGYEMIALTSLVTLLVAGAVAVPVAWTFYSR